MFRNILGAQKHFSISPDYKCPHRASTYQVRNLAAEKQKTLISLYERHRRSHFWPGTIISSRCYRRCHLSQQVSYKTKFCPWLYIKSQRWKLLWLSAMQSMLPRFRNFLTDQRPTIELFDGDRKLCPAKKMSRENEDETNVPRCCISTQPNTIILSPTKVFERLSTLFQIPQLGMLKVFSKKWHFCQFFLGNCLIVGEVLFRNFSPLCQSQPTKNTWNEGKYST